MVSEAIRIIGWTSVVILSTNFASGCPLHTSEFKQTAEKATDDIPDLNVPPITIDAIKKKLKETGVFDYQDASLTDTESKELHKLFDVIEIMVSSRARQPSSVQNLFSSLRLVERVVNKQLKEGHISQTLAAKFHWDKLLRRQRRDKPMYYFDKTNNMRIFNLSS